MTADTTNRMLGQPDRTFPEQFMSDPAEVQRTPEEKERILAHLTLALAALNNEEGRANGDA